jgi:hypothetical protein
MACALSREQTFHKFVIHLAARVFSAAERSQLRMGYTRGAILAKFEPIQDEF